MSLKRTEIESVGQASLYTINPALQDCECNRLFSPTMLKLLGTIRDESLFWLLCCEARFIQFPQTSPVGESLSREARTVVKELREQGT